MDLHSLPFHAADDRDLPDTDRHLFCGFAAASVDDGGRSGRIRSFGVRASQHAQDDSHRDASKSHARFSRDTCVARKTEAPHPSSVTFYFYTGKHNGEAFIQDVSLPPSLGGVGGPARQIG